MSLNSYCHSLIVNSQTNNDETNKIKKRIRHRIEGQFKVHTILIQKRESPISFFLCLACSSLLRWSHSTWSTGSDHPPPLSYLFPATSRFLSVPQHESRVVRSSLLLSIQSRQILFLFWISVLVLPKDD